MPTYPRKRRLWWSLTFYELGGVPRLQLAAGPPCETAFEVFDFKTL